LVGFKEKKWMSIIERSEEEQQKIQKIKTKLYELEQQLVEEKWLPILNRDFTINEKKSIIEQNCLS